MSLERDGEDDEKIAVAIVSNGWLGSRLLFSAGRKTETIVNFDDDKVAESVELLEQAGLLVKRDDSISLTAKGQKVYSELTD